MNALLVVAIFCLAMALAWSKANSYNQIKQLQTELTLLQELKTKSDTDQERLIKSEVSNRVLAWQAKEEPRIRADAASRSTSVNTGFMVEHFTPLLTEFNPAEFRHIGNPIDFVVFEGYETKDVKRIILLDTKTGSSKLTTGQRRIRDAVVAGRVAFATFNPETGLRIWEPHASTVQSE